MPTWTSRPTALYCSSIQSKQSRRNQGLGGLLPGGCRHIRPCAGFLARAGRRTYGVPIEANGLFFRSGTTEIAERKAGFRHGNSNDDWSGDSEAKTDLQAGTGIRTDKRVR